MTMPDGPRYDDDYYAWTQYQAGVLRTMRRTDNRLDREHLAEEIEDLGKSERNSVYSQVTRILEHFLKLAYSPTDRPRHGWIASIVEARQALGRHLTPTLRNAAQQAFADLYGDAREIAVVRLREHGEETAAEALPETCPYTLEQVVTRGWYPEPARPD
ncbi:MAG TPA: DUF29 domain-containing protein [Stellaceae bacterium]|jgi:hypothetical protein|nr:DUF29 domain-containing protein [Stellaceae bacterium]